MSRRAVQTAKYWVDEFQLTQADVEHLNTILLESETPLSAEEMALVLVRYRVFLAAEDEITGGVSPGKDAYSPARSYTKGDKLSLPALSGVKGAVIAVRPGTNPDYGEYSVITVELENGRVVDLASDLTVDHVLIVEEEPEEDETVDASVDEMTPEELFIEFGGYVSEILEDTLDEQPDLVRLAGRYFPKSLLIEVNDGHLNLAEAILDMTGGGPMTTPDILEQVGMLQGINPRLAEFSMNYVLQEDKRFDEVGAAGQVMWFLQRMEPEGVLTPPHWLGYTEIPFDPDLFTDELVELIVDIGDEHSKLARRRRPRPDTVTLTLTYPHQQAGTIPLSSQLRRMFPTAYAAPRIRFTLVDPESEEEIPAWVVRKHGYVYGLQAWFERREVPIGGYVSISRTDEPGQVEISYAARKNARTEWVPTAFVDGDHLRFENISRPIGCDYDDLLIVHVDQPSEADELAARLRDKGVEFDRIVEGVLHSLSPIGTQGSVHINTLYSAVNILRRCPPEPIISSLLKNERVEHIGGPYWRLASQSK